MVARPFRILMVAILSFAPPAAVVFAQGPVSSTQSYSSQVALEAKQVSEDFVPDANLGKKVWQKAKWAQFEKSMSGKDKYR